MHASDHLCQCEDEAANTQEDFDHVHRQETRHNRPQTLHVGQGLPQFSVETSLVDEFAMSLVASLAGESAPRHVSFSFQQCSYVVEISCALGLCGRRNREAKFLLRDVACEVNSGEVLAVMGPSGAGKTTLLRLLSFHSCGGEAFGVVTLNGQDFTPSMYMRHCAYVEQEDTLWTFLTCRDHVSYAVELGMPMLSQKDKQSTVDALLHDLGLESCALTIAGNPLIEGVPALSGGQRRRLSLAVALAKCPSLIFLDEVTSGLDSTSAASVMHKLKELATERALAVICTVHQPASSVFAGLDRALILTGGCVAYAGSARGLTEYMSEIGSPVPVGANPAEFVLNTVNADFVSSDVVEAVLERWAAREPRNVDLVATRSLPEVRHTSIRAQTPILIRRHFMLSVKDPLLYSSRMIVTVVSVTFYGVSFIHSREQSQDQILPRVFFASYAIGTAPLLGLAAVVGFFFEGVVVRHDLMEAAYSPFAYFLSTSLLQFPFCVLISLCACVTGWTIGNWHWPAMPLDVIILTVAFWCFDCVVLFCSLFENPVLGMLSYQTFWFASFVFNGMFVPRDEIVWPVRVMAYASPFYWSTKSFVWVLFKDIPDYEDALVCIPGEPTSVGGVCNDQGFYCPSHGDLQCFGRTGLQQLESVSDTYRVIDSSDTLATDLGVMALVGVVFKIAQMIRLLQKVGNRPHVKKPKGINDSAHVLERVTNAGQRSPEEVSTVPSQRPSYQFDFRNCSFSVRTRADGRPLWSQHLAPCVHTKEKVLLKDVSATVRGGEVLAIMGPSGCGKTTLLNMLSFEHVAGKARGRVSLNGTRLTPTTYTRHCAMVDQKITIMLHLTVREHILYSLSLLAGSTSGEGADVLLDQLGLSSCQYTTVKHISGGQRRRLAIAFALVKKPLLIFLDEPTTGLDSVSAAAVMSLLHEVSRVNNTAMLCTIHQPSVKIFEHFENTMVLSGGRVAYLGKAAKMGHYLETLGKPVPNNTSVSDWMIDVVDRDFTDIHEVDKVLDAYAESSEDLPASQESPVDVPGHEASTTLKQFRVLLCRQCILAT